MDCGSTETSFICLFEIPGHIEIATPTQAMLWGWGKATFCLTIRSWRKYKQSIWKQQFMEQKLHASPLTFARNILTCIIQLFFWWLLLNTY